VRKIHLMNEEKRDATLALESVKERPAPVTGLPGGKKLSFRRYLATTEAGTFAKLSAQAGDLAQALIDGDPEIDIEQVGKQVGDTQTVFLSSKGEVLHASPQAVEVQIGPDGVERERKPWTDTEANTNEPGAPVRWARRMSRAEVVTKFAFARTVQIKHVDGLSFDFLFKMAKELHDKGEVALVGGGAKGRDPLVFQENGTKYRGFLEGRVDGARYKLLLHLSNLELRAPGAAAT
jgi:hypothetical protein